MVEPQFFLQLLMRLFTDPTRLNGSCQCLKRNVSGQIRDVVLLLSARSSFAQDPHFIARHTLDTFIEQDRKSTRLNSSHQIISYAVFCLKKKIPRESTNHPSCRPRCQLLQSSRSAST